jgi:amino acid adenylation domain-containing protein
MVPPVVFDPAVVEQSVAELFERQAAETPALLALEQGDLSLSYAGLNGAANRIARAIVQARPNGPEPVAILMEHGAAAIVALLAVCKAGKFFVPLDASLSDARLAAILEDSGASLVVTNLTQRERAITLAGADRVLLDAGAQAQASSSENLGLSIDAGSLLNIVYTSGSTGEPKGVVQLQRNVVHERFSTDFPKRLPDDRVAQITPYSFGAATASILRVLSSGAALFPFDLKREGLQRLAAFIEREQITGFHAVPAIVRNWLALLPPDKTFPSVRIVEMGGEPVLARDVERLKRHLSPGTRFRLGFGTTETYLAAWHIFEDPREFDSEVLPVGGPPIGKEILLLNENGEPVPQGEVGELWVKSAFLSPGYWRRPDLNAALYRDADDESGARLYRTGDLARWRDDGLLEHLGRRDDVVKIRGQQVALGAVQAALRALDGIKDAAVIAQPSPWGDRQLVAYVVPGDDRPPRGEVLRAGLAALPAAMIPASFVVLEALPLLPTGKLDRRALPATHTTRPELARPYAPPETPLERELAAIWSVVLGIERVGIDDSFVELGGNSLQAAQVIARAGQLAGLELPATAVLQAATVRELAALVSDLMIESVAPEDLEQLLAQVEAVNEET